MSADAGTGGVGGGGGGVVYCPMAFFPKLASRLNMTLTSGLAAVGIQTLDFFIFFFVMGKTRKTKQQQNALILFLEFEWRANEGKNTKLGFQTFR